MVNEGLARTKEEELTPKPVTSTVTSFWGSSARPVMGRGASRGCGVGAGGPWSPIGCSRAWKTGQLDGICSREDERGRERMEGLKHSAALNRQL